MRHKRIFNKPYQKDRRRYLRNNTTKAETILWSHLRVRQMAGYKFRRQQGIDGYIVDFYCPELKLAIEVDGDSHCSQEDIAYDDQRQRYIESLGIKFLRFSNLEIYDDLESVLDKIAKFIYGQPPLRKAGDLNKNSSPHGGEVGRG